MVRVGLSDLHGNLQHAENLGSQKFKPQRSHLFIEGSDFTSSPAFLCEVSIVFSSHLAQTMTLGYDLSRHCDLEEYVGPLFKISEQN